jgi:hypothetical protein
MAGKNRVGVSDDPLGQSAWRVAVILVALLAFLVRLLIIGHSQGGSDLANYTYFSRIALHGGNPFTPPAHGLFPPSYANNPPIEFASFAGLLAIHDSATTLRVLFALSDLLIVLFIGFAFPWSQVRRMALIVFYAFNPLVLLWWTFWAEDKTLLFLGIVVLLWALERDRTWIAWGAAAALAAFKFLGAFFAPVLAVHEFRRTRWRALEPIAAFAVVALVSNAPWFPRSLDAFTRRNDRLAFNPPVHISPTLLISRIGLYAPIEAQLIPALGIVFVVALLIARRINVREAVVWSLFVSYVFLPDDDVDRLVLITLPFLLIMRISVLEWAAIWIASLWATVASVIATNGVPHALDSLRGPLQSVFSHEGTVRSVIWTCLPTVLVLAVYFRGRQQRPRQPAVEVSHDGQTSALPPRSAITDATAPGASRCTAWPAPGTTITSASGSADAI